MLSRTFRLLTIPCVFFATLGFVRFASAQPTPADNEIIAPFSQRSWARADGLPSNEVRGLCVDRAGYLWIATSAGLARFDGRRFLNHPFMSGDERASAGLGFIAADPADDVLWAAPRAGGLMRFSGGVFAPFPLPEMFERRHVTSLFFAADRALWIAFEGGDVIRFHEGRPEIFDSRHGFIPGRESHVASEGTGRVWISNGAHLMWYESGQLHPFSLGVHNEDIRIASARKDGPWLLTRGWLHKLVDDHLGIKIRISGNYNAHSVQALLEDSTGAMWIGTRSRGLRRFVPPDVDDRKIISTPEDIGVLTQDSSGNLWVGSDGGGLLRLRTGLVRRFDRAQGLLENHSLSVCEDNAGTIWIANRDGGVAYINSDSRIRALEPLPTLETFSAYSLAPMEKFGVWVASSHGLLRATQQGVERLGMPEQSLGIVHVTHATRRGDLWLALASGRVARLRDGRWDLFGKTEGLGSAAVHAIAEDSRERIWIGTEGTGLYRFENERFTRVSLPLPADAGAIQAIHFDDTGKGWIGTSGAGLMQLDAATARPLDEERGLPAANITQIISDDQGSLWFGSPAGIYRIRRTELEDFFSGRVSHVDAAIIGEDEGLKETTCLGAYQPSAWKDRTGMLWFATRQGLVAINPRREKEINEPLQVRVDAFRADGVAHQPGGAVRISAQTRAVEFDVSVLCLSTPERVRSQFRLRGYDDDWNTADPRTPIRYSRLPPGQYVFEFTAHVAGAAQSAASTTLPLVVEAAWWQTLWFRLGIAALGLFLCGLAVRTWSHRRLHARIEHLEQASAIERERARIAQNIHDDLGAGLTRISLLTQTTKVDDTRGQLDKIYQTVSGLTRSMDEIVWAVNPKNDNLENFANYLVEFAQGFLTDANIRCRVLLPEVLPAFPLTAQFRHHLFLSCKEALNNIAKHAHATEVTVQLRVENEQLIVIVSDNGRGLDQSDATRDPARSGAKNGLDNMRARLSVLGGSCEITSSASGTVVTFLAPLRTPSPTP